MWKKILLILGMIVFNSINLTNLYADNIQILPLKKPSLSSEEIIKKISKNIILPIKKPSKIKKIVVEKIEEKKLSFKIPKKKPIIAGISVSKDIKISKYYSKKGDI